MHFRQRLALELGEAVVYDLRNEIFAHLQPLPMSFFNRTKLGRIISRMSSDVEDVRMGVQEVLFVSLVSLGQMVVAAAFMLWYDSMLFLMVLGLVPVLWAINHYFRRKMSIALRRLRESFSRVTATLAESVNGIRVTQGFVRQDANAEMFGELVADHAQYNAVRQPDARAVSAALGFEQPVLRRRCCCSSAAIKCCVRGARPTSAIWSAFCSWPSMFFSPITDARQPIQPGPDGDGRRRTRVSSCSIRRPSGATRRRQPRFRRSAGGLSFAICRSATIRNGRCCMASNFMAEPGEIDRAGRPHRQRQDVDHQSDRQVLSAHFRPTADRRTRYPSDYLRIAAPADRHRAAKQFLVQRYRAGKHPRRPARGDRRGSARCGAPPRLPRFDRRLCPRDWRRRSASAAAICRWVSGKSSALPGRCWPTRGF